MGHTSSNCLSCSRIAVSSSPGNQGIPGLSCLALRPPPSLSSLARYSCLSRNIALRHSLSNCRCHYGFDVQDGLNAAKLYQPKSKYKVRLEFSERDPCFQSRQNRFENRALSKSARRAAHHRPGAVKRPCLDQHDREFCHKFVDFG